MATIAEGMAQARRHHQAGSLSLAESLYRQVLELDAANAEARYLLGSVCHQLNRLPEAITHYQRAIELSPGLGSAFLNLADVLERLGNLRGAADCLRHCLLRLPEFPEAHYNLGNVQRALGHPLEAAAHYREAIRLKPSFAQAHNNLGSILLTLDQVDEAVEHFEQALRVQPDYVEAHYNRGNALREQQQLAAALDAYQQALRLQPDYTLGHCALAEAYLELGDAQAAQTHWRKALSNNPAAVRALLGLAANGFYTAADPGVGQLRSWLASPRLSADVASQLHFTLGYLLDRSGATDEAFEHFRQGNALRRALFQQSGTAFDPDNHARRIDRLIAVFTPEYFRRTSGFGLASELPVFIVGMPRSGTTLVEQIVSHHSQVSGGGELKDIRQIVAALPARLAGDYPECLARLDAATARAFAATYLGRLAQSNRTALRVTDKMLENVLHLGLIATLFPQARVIHCRRDPRDVGLSCFMQFFKGLSFAWDLDDLGRYYRDYERLMTHWRKVLPLSMLQVDYEDLVADPQVVSRRLISFCGLDWEDRCLRFHENPRPVQTMSALQVRQPIYAGSVGRWRRYEAHLGPFLEALASVAA